jgi:hypothetical protein
MAPPGGGKRYDDEDDYYPSRPAATLAPTLSLLEGDLTTKSIEDVVNVLPTPTDTNYLSKPFHNKPYPPPMTGPPTRSPPPWTTSGGVSSVSEVQSSALPTWTTSTVTASPRPDSLSLTKSTSLSSVSGTDDASWPTDSSYGHGYGSGGGGYNWGPSSEKNNNDGMYAAAAVTPIVVLVIIAAIVFFCMRKRKRQRRETVEAAQVEEMKMRSQTPPTARAYMASPLGTTPQHTLSNNHLFPAPNSASMEPIILGPIPSGANGAYFTGIDTSDAVSMSSTNNFRPPPNPFSDNESLSEPPPPYRPRSVAPPSFTNSSRQSSIRAPIPPPATSQTHLVERSPFENPFDDDMISELSGPTAGRSEDAMSAVSHLSYQNDPVVNRPTI